MPGYYVHFASCCSNVRENLSFLRGVEAPDILKKHFQLYGIEGARDKYNLIKTENMPDYCELETRIQQKETTENTDGLHYGVSSNPGIFLFWNSLSEEQKQNPFYRGYLWHLITDKLIYTWIDIDSKFEAFLKAGKDDSNIEDFKKNLHNDWNKINIKIRDTYLDVLLPPEVMELGVVQFMEDGELHYVDWKILKETIDFLREFDPIQENMDEILYFIMSKTE